MKNFLIVLITLTITSNSTYAVSPAAQAQSNVAIEAVHLGTLLSIMDYNGKAMQATNQESLRSSFFTIVPFVLLYIFRNSAVDSFGFFVDLASDHKIESLALSGICLTLGSYELFKSNYKTISELDQSMQNETAISELARIQQKLYSIDKSQPKYSIDENELPTVKENLSNELAQASVENRAPDFYQAVVNSKVVDVRVTQTIHKIMDQTIALASKNSEANSESQFISNAQILLNQAKALKIQPENVVNSTKKLDRAIQVLKKIES